MVSVAIVGAGFSGLGLAINLKQSGMTVGITIYEAADDVGGTWRQNHYPGCACDVPSVAYCYSFEPYPWPKHFSDQADILKYLHHCADKYNLWPHIRLNTRVTGAAFDASKAVWRVSTAAGGQQEVQFLVLAQGPLSVPVTPDIPGLAKFRGPILHTAAWDSSVDLAGKTVAVVGTGASAIQVIPQLQQVAGQVVVFQRTPAWVLPREQLGPLWVAPAAQHTHPLWQWLHRQLVFWRGELLLGLPLITNNWLMKQWLKHMCLSNLRGAVQDPNLRALLTPSYSVGCKRILLSDNYYPAMAAPNVRLVPWGLKQVLPDKSTLEAVNGDRVPDVDAIVFATGFDTKAPLAQFEIIARGLNLGQVVASKPEAYLGTAIAGFPNLFTMLGFNTVLGHNSMVIMAECQANLIVQLIRDHMLSSGSQWVEVSQAAQAAFNQGIQERLQRSVWLSGCSSWYLDPPVQADTALEGVEEAGVAHSTAAHDKAHALPDSSRHSSSHNSGSRGRIGGPSGGFALWPGLCAEYWWRTCRPRAEDWVLGKAQDSNPAADDEADAPWSAGDPAADGVAVVTANSK